MELDVPKTTPYPVIIAALFHNGTLITGSSALLCVGASCPRRVSTKCHQDLARALSSPGCWTRATYMQPEIRGSPQTRLLFKKGSVEVHFSFPECQFPSAPTWAERRFRSLVFLCFKSVLYPIYRHETLQF